MNKDEAQLTLPLSSPLSKDNRALWTPFEIFQSLDQETMALLGEDRRLEYKRAQTIDFEAYATYLSAFSNTVDGGVIVFGADSNGCPTGCKDVALAQLNKLEHVHMTMCPMAAPQFRRFSVRLNEQEDYCIAVYVPYMRKLVETHKGEAWARYGDQRHKMSDDAKRDYRATRGELAYELESTSYTYPDDFDLNVKLMSPYLTGD